jgi:hypothetical protein
MNYPYLREYVASKTAIIYFQNKRRIIKFIYPDTLHYRDSFDKQISLHFAFEI